MTVEEAAADVDRRVRRLGDDEIASYDVLPAELARRVWVVRVPEVPGPYVGLTLGRVVLLARPVPTDGWSMLLCHELVHVRQWADLGVGRFLWRYLGDFVRGVRRHRRWGPAYADIRAEVEARQISREWMRRRNARGPRTD